jgi:predicted glycosyltransferase
MLTERMKDIATYESVSDLKKLRENAIRMGRDDVLDQIFKRICELEGRTFQPGIERDFHEVLSAYEQILSEKNGRNQLAHRTRQKLKNKGLMQCLEDWALNSQPTEGFKLLVEKGLIELTAEYIVIKHSEHFPEAVVEAAKNRLEPYLPNP